MKSARPADFSSVSTTTTEESISRSGEGIGLSTVCHGRAEVSHLLLIGTLKPNYRIFAENTDAGAVAPLQHTTHLRYNGGDLSKMIDPLIGPSRLPVTHKQDGLLDLENLEVIPIRINGLKKLFLIHREGGPVSEYLIFGAQPASLF